MFKGALSPCCDQVLSGLVRGPSSDSQSTDLLTRSIAPGVEVGK